jgi:hypothetical protein
MDSWLDEEAGMADKTHDQRDSVESAKEALRLVRLAGRLSTSAQILGDAANAIHLAAALALGAGGLQDAPQDKSDDSPVDNILVNEQDIEFIQDLARQQNGGGTSFAGCLHAYRDAVDAALETTAPGTPIRNKIMNAAYVQYIHCLRLPKALIVVPEEE